MCLYIIFQIYENTTTPHLLHVYLQQITMLFNYNAVPACETAIPPSNSALAQIATFIVESNDHIDMMLRNKL